MEALKIPVAVEPAYDVYLGEGILSQCGEIIASLLKPCKAAVITDTNVGPLYLKTVTESLSASGFTVSSFAFPAGEASKHMGTLSDVLEFLAAKQLTRSDIVVALGGGVVGDLAGFAAGCYLRGIRFVQLPTTLLAAVDSSVGGKTAVDLSAGKNLAGLFWQPAAVICDTAVLQKLPGDIFAQGAAEAVKTGVLAGEALFHLCENGGVMRNLQAVVAGCVRHKASVVEQDERESGLRKTLNLGHTPAHAIELLSDFAVPHGNAVAVGLAMMARASEKMGDAAPGFAKRVVSALKAAELPTSTDYHPAEMTKASFADKKRCGSGITIALPTAIGVCELRSISMDALEQVFAAGMEA